MMTTAAALMGTLPIALGLGAGKAKPVVPWAWQWWEGLVVSSATDALRITPVNLHLHGAVQFDGARNLQRHHMTVSILRRNRSPRCTNHWELRRRPTNDDVPGCRDPD